MQFHVRAVLQTVVVLVALSMSTRVGADPLPASTLGWMINGVVSEVARAGDVAYVGGSFRMVSPSANLVFRSATFSTTAAVAVLPRLDLNGTLRAVVALPGGGWMIGGEFTQVNGTGRNHLARLAPDGTLDSSFNVSVDDTVRTLAVSSTTVYLGGDFGNVGGLPHQLVAAIDLTSGAVNTGFAPLVAGGSIFDLLLDGATLYAAGDFASVDSISRSRVAAVNATTGALLAFDPNADGRVVRLLKSGSSVFAAGEFQMIGGVSRRGVAKLNATTGAADASFNAQMATDVRAMAAGPAALFVGGSFSQAGGTSRTHLAALDLSTGTATSWNPDADGTVDAMGLSGTTLFVTGDFEHMGDTERLFVAALDTTVTSNQVLPWNPALNSDGDFLTVDAAGNVFVAGSFTGFGAVRRDNLAAINLHNGDLLSWNPGTNGWVRALDVHGSTVLLGGDFTEIAGVSRDHIAAINGLTGVATTWRPEANAAVSGIMVAVDIVYFVGDFSSVGSGAGAVSRARGAAFHIDGTVQPWNPAANDSIESLFVDGTTVYVGGGFTMLGAATRNRLGAVDAISGAVLGNFAPNVDAVIYRVDVQSAIVYFGGAFQAVNGTSRNHAAAVAGFSTAASTAPAASGTLLAWSPDVSGPIYDIDAFGSVVYLAGGFGAVDGESRPGIAVVSADHTNAALGSWKPADVSGGNISVIDTSGDAVLFGGGLSDLDNISIGAVLYPEASLLGAPRPPTTPTLRVRGSSLGMSWTRPPLGAVPASYVIEGGSASGRVDLANFSTGTPATHFDGPSLPAGTYFVRMRAANAFGMSVAGDEQAFTIGLGGCVSPPEPPLDVAASVSGAAVTLSWREAPQSTVAGHLIRVGSVSGLSNLITLPVGNISSVTVNAPPGAFFVKIAATNECGIGPNSPEAVVVVGNAVVPPVAPFELQSTVVSRTLTLAWAAPPVGSAPFQYVIEAGSAPGQSNVAAVAVGTLTSLVTPIAPGIYYVRVRAIGPGGMGPGSNEVTVVVQ